MTSPYDQSGYAVRFEWGEQGLATLGQGGGVFILVDVLSFCTCVEVAAARGAQVLPFQYRDNRAIDYAKEQKAILAAQERTTEGYSLSPASLTDLPKGAKLVLPSPNGATLSLQSAALGTTVAACLRNARAVAEFARSRPGPVNVIACGERWPDGRLRPCWEDLVGAPCSPICRPCSPEAESAVAAFPRSEGRCSIACKLALPAAVDRARVRGRCRTGPAFDVSARVPVLCGRL